MFRVSAIKPLILLDGTYHPWAARAPLLEMGIILRPVGLGNFPNYPEDFVNLEQAGATVIKKTVCYGSSLRARIIELPPGFALAQFLVHIFFFFFTVLALYAMAWRKS